MSQAKKVLHNAMRKGIYLYVESGKLKFKSQPGAMNDELMSQIKSQKRAIISILSDTEHNRTAVNLPKIIALHETQAPLSNAQKRLWFIDKMEGQSAQYNIPLAMEVKGCFSLSIAKQALIHIIARHHVLRTAFVEKHGQIYQQVRETFDFDITQTDLSNLNEDQCLESVRMLANNDASQSFDLANDLLIRCHHIYLDKRLGKETGVVLFNMHHIISDGWSMNILFNEFMQSYEALNNGITTALEPLSIQYTDYAIWQQKWLKDEVLSAQLNYWTSELADLPQLHSLPLDFPRPTIKKHKAGMVTGYLTAEQKNKVEQLANQRGMTPFMIIHAALVLLIARHSNSDDIVIGTPVANRMEKSLETLIGLFVNTLVLRASTKFSSVDEFLNHIKAINLDAQSNQDIPFEQLLEVCKVERSIQHSPMFQIMLSMNNTESDQNNTISDLNFKPLNAADETVKFDLDISLSFGSQGIHVGWLYDESIFSKTTIETFNQHWQRLLTSFLDQPYTTISEVPMLSKTEINDQLYVLNNIDLSFESRGPLHQKFSVIAKQYPDNLALICGSQQLNYNELNTLSYQWANLLQNSGVKTGDLVGIHLPRSIDLVVAIISVLKTGAAYLPLDPNYPQQRLDYMCADSGVRFVLGHNNLQQKLQCSDKLQYLCMDDCFDEQIAHIAESSDFNDLPSSALAYIIYTSGSTGQPKGVMQSHENVERLLWASQENFSFNADDVWTLFHSAAFDFSVWELWGALLYGGKLIIPDHETTRNPKRFIELCQQHEVTVLNQTPSAFGLFMQQALQQDADLQSLKYIIFGGEQLKSETLELWWSHYGNQATQLINMYGITETTVHVSYSLLSSHDKQVTIGNRLNDQVLYLLDKDMNVVPYGRVGEIYVGGAGLSPGYLKRPTLNSERFIANPFATEAMKSKGYDRLYKTGDLGKYTPNGTLLHMGRNDDQVKLRGFRIELGEIASYLMKHESVMKSIVMLINQQLVAYIELQVDQPELPNHDWQGVLVHHCKNHLPEHMVPNTIVLIENWPLTENGKTNLHALPSPEVNASVVFEPTITKQEQLIAQVWGKTLEMDWEKIGRYDNFFALGGHSLLIIRYRSLLNEQGHDLPITTLYQSKTLADLALQLQNSIDSHAPTTSIPEGCSRLTADMFAMIDLTDQQLQQISQDVAGGIENIQDIYPLSPLQSGMLFHALAHPDSDPYVIKMVFKCQDLSSIKQLQAALNFVISRHDALRSQIVHEYSDEAVQVVLKNTEIPVVRWELNDEIDIEKWLRNHDLGTDNHIYLDRAPLLQLHIITHDNSYFAILFHHHLIEDNISGRILQSEMGAFLSENKGSLEKPAQYKDFIWHGHKTDHNQATNFFKQYLSGFDEPTMPIHARHSVELLQPSSVRLSLPEKVAIRLHNVCQEHGLSLACVFHLGWAMVLSRCFNRKDVVFGSVFSGRMRGLKGIEQMVGLCINTLAIRIQPADQDLQLALSRVDDLLKNLLQYEQTPLSTVKQCCNVPSHLPLFSSVLNCRLQYGDQFQSKDSSVPSNRSIDLQSIEEFTNYPLTVSVDYTKSEVMLTIDDNSGIYSASKLFKYFSNIITSIVDGLADKQLDLTINNLEMLSYEEKQRLLRMAQGPVPNFARSQKIQQLFESQVISHPDSIAVIQQQYSLSYSELNKQANQLAHYLLNQGIVANELVGLYMDRSVTMVVAILATLKAGGTYVPFDPEYPQARISHMVADTAVKNIISQKHLSDRLNGIAASVLIVDSLEFQQDITDLSNENPVTSGSCNDLAYVIYTSGSSGLPKGVMVEHQAVNSLVMSPEFMVLDQETRFLLASSMAFDAATIELWGPLLNGGCLIVYPQQHMDLKILNDCIKDHDVNSMWLTAGLFDQWSQSLDDLPSLRWVLAGGDVLSLSAVKRVHQQLPNIQLVNGYGPTENTTFSCCHVIEKNTPYESIPIGRAVNDTETYVLSATMAMLPQGCVGELYLGGVGLARGYLNHPELTKDKFINNPFNVEARLYKTGDLVYIDKNRVMHFVGRSDDQIKLRGFRVEPDEVQQQLQQLETVASSLVVVALDTLGQKQLLVYFIAHIQDGIPLRNHDDLIKDIKQQLSERLPDHMLPSGFMVMEQWPLTENGKIDKSALPKIQHTTKQHQPAQTDTENHMILLWSELLRIEPQTISTTANFFELGGHSLLAIKLVTEIKQKHAIDIGVEKVFYQQDLQSLCQFIDTELAFIFMKNQESQAVIISEGTL